MITSIFVDFLVSAEFISGRESMQMGALRVACRQHSRAAEVMEHVGLLWPGDKSFRRGREGLPV